MKKKWLLAAGVAVLLVVARCVAAPARDPGAGSPVPDLGTLAAGQTHWGEDRYIEFQVGDLPLIVSAPHGGTLAPEAISDRTRGYAIGDVFSLELTRLFADAFAARTGRRPYLILSLLDRSKLDPNREAGEAADGDPIAERAWGEYHGFIGAARRHVEQTWGSGLYVDLHGHGHRPYWVELGYLLGHDALNGPDGKLDRVPRNRGTSIGALAKSTATPISELVRGPASLGALLEARGYRSVPSPGDPGPGGETYFSGGYSTWRHGSLRGGSISGIQLESPKKGVRDRPENRHAFAGHLAAAMVEFLETHYGLDLEDPSGRKAPEEKE